MYKLEIFAILKEGTLCNQPENVMSRKHRRRSASLQKHGEVKSSRRLGQNQIEQGVKVVENFLIPVDYVPSLPVNCLDHQR